MKDHLNLTPALIDRITALRSEAAAGGDLLLVCYCDVTLGDLPAPETVDALDSRGAERYVESTPETARRACMAALSDADPHRHER